MKRLQKALGYVRRHPGAAFVRFLIYLLSALGIFTVGAMVVYIVVKGVPNLKPELFSPVYTSENASMLPAIINTLIVVGVTMLIAVPIGIFSSVYLVEYAKPGSRFSKLIGTAAETLAGIPSIVYGLFGFIVFVNGMHFGNSLIAGILTLAIMVLPVIMRTSQEALLAVPASYREGSYALGAGKLRTVFKVVLKSAMPSIMSGVILSVGRIVGETAALIYTAGTIPKVAAGLQSSGRTIAVHMYSLMSEGLYMDEAYAAAVILLIIVIVINMLSNLLVKKAEKNE